MWGRNCRMKKHGKFFTINIILAPILSLIISINIIMVVIFNGEFGGSKQTTSNYQWYELLSVEDISTESLGTVYGDETADEGYQYYKINIKMKNQGTQASSRASLSCYFAGEEYEDVKELDETVNSDEASYIEYYNELVIPAGQVGIVSKVIEVKKGISNIQMQFYNEDYEKEDFTLQLQ